MFSAERRQAALLQDPAAVVADFSIDSRTEVSGTSLSPAHHTEQKHTLTDATHQRPARVTLKPPRTTLASTAQATQVTCAIVLHVACNKRHSVLDSYEGTLCIDFLQVFYLYLNCALHCVLGLMEMFIK